MSTEDRIFDALGAIREDIGTLKGQFREHTKNIESYVGAVSANQKETAKKLDEHREDIDAHGKRAMQAVWAGIGAVIGGLASAAAAFEFLKKIKGE